MDRFRQAIRLLLVVTGSVVGMITFLAAYLVRMMVKPPRQPLWASPASAGLPYEEIQFPARDGLRLSGWFIPTHEDFTSPNGVLVLVHGWPWNRLGTMAQSLRLDLAGSSPVQLLDLARMLHQKGYQLLMFDQRNHGRSAQSGPATFGLNEAKDLLGAFDYLAARQDVDAARIGAIGFGMGANALLFSLPQTGLVRAAIAVQPASPENFVRRYCRFIAGPLSALIVPIVALVYRLWSGLRLSAIDPLFVLAGNKQTPVLFVESTADPLGSAEDTAKMAALTPLSSKPFYVDSKERYGACRFLIANPDVVDAFFQEQLSR